MRGCGNAWILLAGMGFVVFPPAVLNAADPLSPAQLVKEMSVALQSLNYEGTFVHVRGASVDSMHIIHGSDSGGELERMLSLNGEAREVIRNHSLVTCIWPGTQSVVISKSKPRKLLPTVDASLADNKQYLLKMAAPDRVAGIDTHVVDIRPHDRLRYGYRFWIDKNTQMLLRSMLIDQNEQPIEQVMFTRIQYPAQIDRSRFDVQVADDKVSWVEPKKLVVPGAQPNKVSFVSLPAGYVEVSETYQPMPVNDAPVSHIMVSDGMASVSVYVEYVDAAKQDMHGSGISSMGAINAYGHSLPNAFVTVVGEVPVATVLKIAQAVRLNE